MPIYEYVCGSCKKKTEVIQRMNEARLKVCPHCGGKLTKMFSAPAIQFKGSGFYITDYAKAKSEEAGGKKSGGGEKADTGDAAEKADKSESAGKAEKAEKAEKVEKVEKKAEKKKEKKAAD